MGKMALHLFGNERLERALVAIRSLNDLECWAWKSHVLNGVNGGNSDSRIQSTGHVLFYNNT